MRVLFFLLFFYCLPALAQFTDDFTDGDLHVNPTWSGDNAHFIVSGQGQLQLHAPAPGISCLRTASTVLRDAQWNFWVKLAFSPSDNNLLKIYLSSDNPDLKGPLKGYFIRLGENGAADGIDLWAQNGYAETKLIDGINGHCAKSNNTLRIKITRDKAGLWSLFSDTLGGYDFKPEGSAPDTGSATAAFFGIYCKYTASNASRFFFDDFYAGPIHTDTTAPRIQSIEVLSDTVLRVLFNEALDTGSAKNTAHYHVNPIGNPVSVNPDINNPRKIHLRFPLRFIPGTPYFLATSNIKDLAGNKSLPASDAFLYHVPGIHDVVINEIMADPSPSVNLPEYEYVELHNTASFPIRLNKWLFTSGTVSRPLPDVVILPDSFLVLCPVAALPHFEPGTAVTGITGFPALNNKAGTLTLKTATGALITAVSYTDSWYRNEHKREGGWSLEMIDAANPCGGSSNWKAAVSSSGGSPGKKNSVAGYNPDTVNTRISRVNVLSPDSLEVLFNEGTDSLSLTDPAMYVIDGLTGPPVAVDLLAPEYKGVILLLGSKLQPNFIYTLRLKGPVADCRGNTSFMENSIPFALPDTAFPSDIVINEILFDPFSGGVDFVEVYNRSSKVIDLSSLCLSTADSLSGNLNDARPLSLQARHIMPGEYFILSPDFGAVKRFYRSPFAAFFVDMPQFPPLKKESGHVVLLSKQGTVIDHVAYEETMHFPLLRDTKGVSLERVHPHRPSLERTNWHSAAEQAGYATPASKNSQFSDHTGSGSVNIHPEVFSPDNDGYNDLLTIHCTFAPGRRTGSITIFDVQGREVRKLVSNQLLGAENHYSWDGIDENRTKAPLGVYIVLVKVFDESGNTSSYKKTCVLAEKL